MKKQNLLVWIVLLVSVFAIGCQSATEQAKTEQDKAEQTSAVPYAKISGDAFGTMYNVTYSTEQDTLQKAELDSVLQVFDNSLSTYNSNSLIAKINSGEDLTVDSLFAHVFRSAMGVSEATNGLFDVTVAPLVNAWGFGFKNKENITDERVKELLKYVDYRQVHLENKKVVKDKPEIMFDFNAIAKGYGVDYLAGFMNKKGVKNYLIEIGGEIVAVGESPSGKAWRVGIDKPADNAMPGEDLEAIIQFTNRAMATSGNYRRFYIKDGVKYAHTINPKTGYPVNHTLLSTTVLAKDCMTADAYATAFMVMGLEAAQQFLESHKDLDAYFIYSDTDGKYLDWQTTGMSALSETLENKPE